MRRFALLRAMAALLMAILPGSAVHAQLPGTEIHVHAGLEAETRTPAAGTRVTLAITMRPDPGWHGYWQNPGDAGEGLMLDWSLPPGVTASVLRFPVPDTLIISGFMNYVYEEPHAVLVDLNLSPKLAKGTRLPVSAVANWLACTDRVCVPQQGTLSTELVIGDGMVAKASRARFDQWRAVLPVPLDREAHFTVNGKRIHIAIPFPANAKLAEPFFFPVTLNLFNYMAPQNVRRAGNWLVIETQISKQHKGKMPPFIEGLFRIGPGQGLVIRASEGAVPAGGVAVEPGTSDVPPAKVPPLYLLLLGALFGGLLLNVMPCVFPILGLKAVALAKAGGDERSARHDALAYTAGVVLSCLALGAIMLVLRAGGEEIGWAFQLQEPGFVLFLLLLMVGVSANLAGLFELESFGAGGALAQSGGLSGSFWTGALAAIVATPCTGPFMAAALGAALLLPTALALMLFAVLGFGIALPFLLITFVPAFRRLLPRPGPWLAGFRRAMAIPMGLTAVALLWLLWRLSGQIGLMVGLIAVAVFLILVFALVRRRQTNSGLMALGLGLSLTVIGAYGLPDVGDVKTVRVATLLPSKPFDENRLAALRAAGKPVFVYFTADWCVTCKVNEATVLEREETAKLFADNDVAVLRGDFTQRSPAIARFLALHGHAGVPLYLYYPENGAPKQLSQILTPSAIASIIKSE